MSNGGNCDKALAEGGWCGAPLSWKEWDNEQGGFWACPNYKNHVPKSPGARQGGGGRPQQGPSRPAGAPNGSRPATDSARSIEAQTAVRGACDVAAAIGPALLAAENASASVVTEFAVTLARRLLREVVYPVTGAPIPSGLAVPRSGFGARGLAPQNTGPTFPGDAPDDDFPPYGDER